MNENKMTTELTVLLISDDAALCAAARHELETRNRRLRVATVSTVDAARSVLAEAQPTAILLEDASLYVAPEGPRRLVPRLDAVVSALAVYAPVVVIGAPERREELSALVAAGAADFVARAGGCVPLALGLVERRLRQSRREVTFAVEISQVQATAQAASGFGEDFGAILRHELNNPLTGILGNSELLLASIRRRNDGRIPVDAQQRLETITALAVRLRETVRRLSQGWEARQTSGQTGWKEVSETAKT
jgi:signal transduction histidine kinase